MYRIAIGDSVRGYFAGERIRQTFFLVGFWNELHELGNKIPARDMRLIAKHQLMILFRHTRSETCGTMLRLVYLTGLRLQEVTGLRVSDLYAEDNLLIVRSGNNPRFVNVPEEMRQELLREAWHKVPMDPLFSLAFRERPVAKRTLQSFLNRACHELGLAPVSLQCLRDNFALRALEKGIPPQIVQKLMGLEHSRSLQKYLNVHAEDKGNLEAY